MESTSATAALEGRYAALRACAEGLSSEELLDVIELAQREKDAASARQAVALAHLSARDFHRQEDGTSVEVHHGLGHQRLDGPELAAPRLGCSVFVATNRILDAIRQMTRTPAVVDAMASGDLDEYRARVVTEETEFLSPESAAEVVDRVKDVWGQLTVGPLRQLLARTAAQVDPDAVAQEAEEERARRGLTRRTGEHGTDHWRGDFRVEDARGAWAAVTERARQLVREGKADSLELARADAMMELILEHSDVKVVVHATRAADDDPSRRHHHARNCPQTIWPRTPPGPPLTRTPATRRRSSPHPGAHPPRPAPPQEPLPPQHAQPQHLPPRPEPLTPRPVRRRTSSRSVGSDRAGQRSCAGNGSTLPAPPTPTVN